MLFWDRFPPLNLLKGHLEGAARRGASRRKSVFYARWIDKLCWDNCKPLYLPRELDPLQSWSLFPWLMIHLSSKLHENQVRSFSFIFEGHSKVRRSPPYIAGLGEDELFITQILYKIWWVLPWPVLHISTKIHENKAGRLCVTLPIDRPPDSR